MPAERHSTGIPALDSMLGGGLLTGRTTVVLGATGIGKTQLGIQYAAAGEQHEGERGIFFDLTSRGDSQNHADYAKRIADWTLQEFDPDDLTELEQVFDCERSRCDTAHLFARSGRRVTQSDLDADAWKEWKAETNRKLADAIRFFYGNFVHGARRVVIDGVEPSDRASDSFQFDLFEYIQHQILRKEHDWVARDLLRVHFRRLSDRVAAHAYDVEDVSAVLLATSHDVLLDDLLARPIESGDPLSNANTIILMGKVRDDDRIGRALCIAKHRGSACDERIVRYEIGESGLSIPDV